MSYKIKHAKQIVFAFVSIPIITMLAALVFIAIRQNLLEKKYVYHSTLTNAMGISTQTPILYRGFEVGRVRSFILEEDGSIGLKFHILKRYKNIMVKGSVLMRTTSPITGKTSLEFIRDPFSQVQLPAESSIPSSDFETGKKLLKHIAPTQSDPISAILANLAEFSANLNEDHNADQGAVFRFLVNLADTAERSKAGMTEAQKAIAEFSVLTQNLNKDDNPDSGVLLRLLNNLANLGESLNARLDEVDAIMKNLNEGIANYAEPDSLLIKMLDPTQEALLKPLSQTLYSLSKASSELGGILAKVNNPELRLLLNNLNQSLEKARKTLDALNNNPLLRKGINPSNQNMAPSSPRLHEVPIAP